MTTISPSKDRLSPAKAARPSEQMPAGTALASLIARVCAARILREHQVWEAVRILPQTADMPEEMKLSSDLRRFMEKDAFAAALRILAQSCQPARDFRDLEPHADHWVATLFLKASLAQPRRRKLVRAKHRDPAAAMLIALLSSADGESKPFVRRRRANAAL